MMKSFVLTFFCVFACALAQTDDSLPKFADRANAVLNGYEFKTKVGSDLVTEDDKKTIERLVGMEKADERNLVENAITDLLESFRVIVLHGNDVLPPLDPLRVPVLGPFTYINIGLRGTLQVNNFDMQGLGWYVVDNVSFSTLRLAIGVKVSLPWLMATGNYDARAVITILSHQAGGSFSMLINDLSTSVNVRLGTNILGGGTLILRELDIHIRVAAVQINIGGMVGSSVLNSMINALIQNATQNLLVDQLDAISQTLSKELFDAIDEVLRNFTIDDLLGIGSGNYIR